MEKDQEIIQKILETTDNINMYSEEEKRNLADITYWMISKDTIIPSEFSYHFGVDINATKIMIEFLTNKGLLNMNGRDITVNATIPDELVHNLKKYYSEDDILKARRNNIPREEKEEKSRLLSSTDYIWNPCIDTMPEPYHVVAIRIENRSKIIAESHIDIEYMEAVYLAVCTEDGDWKIEKPHLAYDLSGLTKGEDVVIDDSIKVTHWAEVGEEDLTKWENRFDLMGDYDHMKFNVSEDKEREVYEALVIASRIIYNNLLGMPENNFKKKVLCAYQVINDLQSTIDNGGYSEK